MPIQSLPRSLRRRALHLGFDSVIALSGQISHGFEIGDRYGAKRDMMRLERKLRVLALLGSTLDVDGTRYSVHVRSVDGEFRAHVSASGQRDPVSGPYYTTDRLDALTTLARMLLDVLKRESVY